MNLSHHPIFTGKRTLDPALFCESPDGAEPVNVPLLIVAAIAFAVMVAGQSWTASNPGKTKPNITGAPSK